MTAIRDRADARWLPSRHRFALFRMIAFVMLRRSKPEPKPGLVVIVDPNQSALETYVLSIWVLATASCYVAASLSSVLIWPAALLLAVPLAALALELPLYIVGLSISTVVPFRHNERINSVATLAAMAAVSIWFVRSASWVRVVAFVFLGAIVLNAAAAVVMFLLRPAVKASEAQFERTR